jgi:hypothetical protein
MQEVELIWNDKRIAFPGGNAFLVAHRPISFRY